MRGMLSIGLSMVLTAVMGQGTARAQTAIALPGAASADWTISLCHFSVSFAR
jgi:hypothetical protein